MRIDLSKHRNMVLFIIILPILSYYVSVFIHYLWIEIFSSVSTYQYPELIHSFTFFASYSLLLFLFDKYSLKYKCLYSLLSFVKIIDFPNLNWTWNWKLVSSFKENGKNKIVDVKLNISQTFNNISIKWEFNESHSISTQSMFWYNDVEQKNCLYYFFKNDPNMRAKETMHPHEWACILCYNPNDDSIKWTYYSWRGRNNFWDITLKRL